MKLTLIVGAGGTGSYFIDEIVHYYNSLKESRKVIVVDGDVVEEKNLLRQGFLTRDLDKGKAEALVNRYKKILREGIELEARDHFINTVGDIVSIATEESYKEITLVSCVDNNMARLRLTFALYALRDVCKCEVRFIDSGNEEWHGQTITSVLRRTGTTYLQGLYKEVTEKGRLGAVKFHPKELHERHIVASIFTTNNDWVNNLTRGDHELSCDEVTESNPQNIGTNMMASRCLLMTVSMLQRKEFEGGEYNFNAQTNSLTRKNDGIKVEPGYEDRLGELLDYIRSEAGYKEVFGEDETLVNVEEDTDNMEDVGELEVSIDNEEEREVVEEGDKEFELDLELELDLEGVEDRSTESERDKCIEDLYNDVFDGLLMDLDEEIEELVENEEDDGDENFDELLDGLDIFN